MHIRYKALENKKIGTHSWYAQPDYTGTLTMDDIIERACRSSTLSEGEARLAMDLIQDTIKSYLLRGYRCQLGKNFLTIYPIFTPCLHLPMFIFTHVYIYPCSCNN